MLAQSSTGGLISGIVRSLSGEERPSSNTSTNAPSPAVQSLIDKLTSGNGKDEEEAASELRVLTRDDPAVRLMLTDGPGTDALVQLMWSDNRKPLEDVVTCLHNISLTEAGHQALLRQPCLEAMLQTLKTGTATVKSNTAATLFNLGKKLGNAAVLAEMPDFFPPLITLLQTGDLRGKKDACYALYCLTTPQKGKLAALALDLVDVLVKVIEVNEGGGMEEKAMAVVVNLAQCSEGQRQLSHEDRIAMLGEIVEAGTGRAKEEAVAVLLCLVQESEDVFQRVEQEGMMPALLNLAKSGKASSAGREKATSLVHMLRRRRDLRNMRNGSVSFNAFSKPGSATEGEKLLSKTNAQSTKDAPRVSSLSVNGGRKEGRSMDFKRPSF